MGRCQAARGVGATAQDGFGVEVADARILENTVRNAVENIALITHFLMHSCPLR